MMVSGSKKRGPVTVTLIALLALVWVFPLFWAVFNSFRTYAYTSQNGYLSLGGWTLDNYQRAWEGADMGRYFWNSVIITVPAVIITLFLASLVAFVLAWSALHRTESRGGHTRTDYPGRGPLRHTVTTLAALLADLQQPAGERERSA